MHRLAASVIVFFTAGAPVFAAQTTDRNESVQDAIPACMERNGPDCTLKSDIYIPRAAPGIIVISPVSVPPTATVPSGTVTAVPSRRTTGLVGSDVVTTPSGTTVIITPSGNSTSTGTTTIPNSVGGNLTSSGNASGTSTSTGVTTNPGSLGGALSSGSTATPGTATTGGGSVRR